MNSKVKKKCKADGRRRGAHDVIFSFLISYSLFARSDVPPVDFSPDIDSLVQQAYTNDPKSFLPLQKSNTHYSSEGSTSVDETNNAMSITGNQITTQFQNVDTGMCTTATVMAFLAEISILQSRQHINLMPETLQQLWIGGADGVGFWGRWDADGPGTALLFQDYKLGRNFQDIKNAKPGDFMKIFWNDRMGEDPDGINSESGHSVIFEGTEEINGVQYLKFWSNNSTNTSGFPDAIGFKMKYRKLSDVQHHIFSRLEHPENLNLLTTSNVPRTNIFLANLLNASYSYADGIQASGLQFSDDVP